MVSEKALFLEKNYANLKLSKSRDSNYRDFYQSKL
jgi:hypothetical protein